MANLIITGFAGIGGNFKDAIQAAGSVTETQVVAIGDSSDASNETEDGTHLVRVYAEADCSIAIGATPIATVAAGIPLTAKTWDYFVIKPGQKIAVIARTVS